MGVCAAEKPTDGLMAWIFIAGCVCVDIWMRADCLGDEEKGRRQGNQSDDIAALRIFYWE